MIRGNYIYKGTKFNSRKEVVISETMHKCSAELVIKTDLQNLDYVAVLGRREISSPEVVANEKKKRETEEMGNAMKCLENRTLDSKREMDILALLDELKSLKSRHATVDIDAKLEALQLIPAVKEKKLGEEDEALLKSIVFHISKDFVCRIEDEDSEDEEDLTQPSASNEESVNNSFKKRKLSEEFSNKPTDSWIKPTSFVPIVVVKKAAPTYSISALEIKQDGADKNGLRTPIQNYETSDDDDDE